MTVCVCVAVLPQPQLLGKEAVAAPPPSVRISKFSWCAAAPRTAPLHSRVRVLVRHRVRVRVWAARGDGKKAVK